MELRNEIILGDCLTVLPTLPQARMIFADPPDNLGVKYADGVTDKRDDYIDWLCTLWSSVYAHQPAVFWFSHYYKHTIPLLRRIPTFGGYVVRQFTWRYTFGQHQEVDCGNGYRPILRFSAPGTIWHTNDIRIPSARLEKYGDKRANPEGRVPDDVWDFPRICGTFKERRAWHPNQHPEALIERMIRMSTRPADLVIDLFAGTGTVNRVCQRLGRSCIGIEISPPYVAKIREELKTHAS